MSPTPAPGVTEKEPTTKRSRTKGVGKNATEKCPNRQKGLEFRVGIAIRMLRIEKHMTQEQLAEKAGIKRATVAMIEVGRRVNSLSTLSKLCDALGVELSGLFGLCEKLRQKSVLLAI